MEAGAYILRLYCDNPYRIKYHRWEKYSKGFEKFVSKTAGGARKAARLKGWRIRKGEVVCPTCERRRHRS